MKFVQARPRLAIYLSLLSVLGMALVFLVTYKFGPGISTDGAKYLSTAQNLLESKGLNDYLNDPLTQFPPLYSLLIAGISLVTRLDVFLAAQYLNILTFGLVIWLAGYFFYKVFPNEPLFSYFGSAIFCTSLSLIIMASNVLSDLLFLAFTLVFLIVATDVLETGTKKNIVLMGLIAAISPFERYAGLALILTGAILVFFLFRKIVIKGMIFGGIFAALTALPILLWVYFHNYVPTGILFGVRLPPNYLGNFQVTLEKMEHWLLPAMLTNVVPWWAIILSAVVLLFAGNRLADWKRLFRFLIDPHFFPSLVFFILYFGVLVFNISYYEVRFPYMDRIHIIIFPALLILIFLTIRELTPALLLRNLSPRKTELFSILLFLTWLTFPVYNIQKYMQKAYSQGDVSEFNMYNIPVLRDSGIREHFSSQPIGDQKVYSNYEAAAWFITRQQITKLPFDDSKSKRINVQEALKEFPGWPGKDGNGYVIWIKALSFKPYVLSPEQLTERADFQLLYSNKAGDIYLLTPK